jgi:short-subunit dehydrogenase
MKNSIVVGLSSGIGKELARVLAAEGYTVGLAARRVDLLEELSKGLLTESRIQAMEALRGLIAKLGDVELFILNAGGSFPD